MSRFSVSTKASARPKRWFRSLRVLISIGIVVLALWVMVWPHGRTTVSGGSGATYAYQVGRPGPGDMSPPIRLAASSGGTLDLSSLRGKTVLVYFQEGVMCQPCWDQLTDIENSIEQFRALGIDNVISVTGDPIGPVTQNAADEKLSTPVLSDPGLAVSKTYDANRYGMMGTSADGHTFVVVGPDGRIRWRADYGGAPKYTMYVPVTALVADLKLGLQKAL